VRVHRLRLPTIAVALLAALLTAPLAIATGQSPNELIHNLIDRVVAELEARPALRSDRDGLRRLVEERVAPAFDFAALSRLALGKHWRTATPEQRARFSDEFHRLLVRTYSGYLGDYDGEAIEYQAQPAPDGAHRAEVLTRVTAPGRPPVTVKYSLLAGAEGWKIYNISVEGISLVTTYRSSFDEEIQRTGLDGLIASLAARNAVSCLAGQSASGQAGSSTC
jgi:phospholipid transport system substrate-binding protein